MTGRHKAMKEKSIKATEEFLDKMSTDNRLYGREDVLPRWLSGKGIVIISLMDQEEPFKAEILEVGRYEYIVSVPQNAYTDDRKHIVRQIVIIPKHNISRIIIESIVEDIPPSPTTDESL